MRQGLFLSTFILSLLAISYVGRVSLLAARQQALNSAGLHSERSLASVQAQAIHTSLPESYTDFSIVTAVQAKREHLFWPNYERAGTLPWLPEKRGFGAEVGVGLRVLENSELSEALFPGYSRSLPPRGDRFWDIYFGRSFNSKTWVPQYATAGFAVMVPWAGCLDVYREAGADIVILGTSETYRGIIPKNLQTKGFPGARVLNCARGGMYLDETLALLSQMNAADRPKVRWAIWGLSPWNLDQNQLDFGHNPARLKESQTELALGSPVLLPHRLSDSFPLLSWSRFLPQTFSGLRKLSQDPELLRWREEQKEYWWGSDRFVFIPKRLTHQGIENFTRGFAKERGKEPETCEISPPMKARFESALTALLNRAEKVLLYVPPVTDIFQGHHSQCQVLTLHQLLEEKRSDRVVIVNRDWKQYDLTYADFVYPSWFKDWDYLNNNHVNYSGAVRVTDALAAEIKVHEASSANHL